jgi:ABC-2 type transport system ATP-binding protein
MSEVMIQVQNLTKDYGPTRAVDGVTFNVRKGEVLGFLGPNGAGKSTTMKMLTCFLAPTGGTAKVAGFDVFDESLEVRKRLGYLPEDTPIYRDMTVVDYLRFAADVRGMEPNLREKRIKEIGGPLRPGRRGRQAGRRAVEGLPPARGPGPGHGARSGHRHPRRAGQRPRPQPEREIRELIKEVGKEKTVILSTHILSDVQATCSRVLIISGGKLVADGTPDELRARERGSRYRVVLESGGSPADTIKARIVSVPGVLRCEKVAAEDGSLAFAIDGSSGEDLRKVLFRTAVDNRWPLLELAREAASLEDVFRTLTTTSGEEKRS